MSHGKERVEKVCLNCGAEPLQDRYCHHCGQQNVEPKQTAWDLVTHFFNDITHFDGKFFSTMKLLLLKPGFLSDEYIKGRRTKYLDPVRMYIFISAVFFIVFYSIFKPPAPPTLKDKPVLDRIDSLRKVKTQTGFQLTMVDMSDQDKKATIFNVHDNFKHGYAHYDSIQNSLPPEKRDGFASRYFRKRMIGTYQTYDANPYNFIPNVILTFQQSFSKIFFITLPIFAFILYVLNLSRRRQYYYVAHAIFSIHYYCVSFLFLLAAMLLVSNITGTFAYTLAYIIAGGMLLYLLVGMHRFYKEDWLITVIKFFVLTCSFAFIFIVLVIIMFFNSLIGAH